MPDGEPDSSLVVIEAEGDEFLFHRSIGGVRAYEFLVLFVILSLPKDLFFYVRSTARSFLSMLVVSISISFFFLVRHFSCFSLRIASFA